MTLKPISLLSCPSHYAFLHNNAYQHIVHGTGGRARHRRTCTASADARITRTGGARHRRTRTAREGEAKQERERERESDRHGQEEGRAITATKFCGDGRGPSQLDNGSEWRSGPTSRRVLM
jgi:hypothetical protein